MENEQIMGSSDPMFIFSILKLALGLNKDIIRASVQEVCIIN